MDKNTIIKTLNMIPLQHEGGYFYQSHWSDEKVEIKKITGELVNRPKSTSILYLIGGEDFSALHKLEFDEFYHFSKGSPAQLFLIYPNGKSELHILGPNFEAGEKLQYLVPAGVLQGIRSAGEWSLLGTYMSPGFDFNDFEMPTRIELLNRHPELKTLILEYTRSS